MMERGDKFGRLTFVCKTDRKTNDNHLIGLWRCDCGELAEISNTRVRNGYTKSCGCLNFDTATGRTHGMRYTGAYASWSSAKDRATNKKSKDFHRYGGIGIGICERWLSFENFYNDMGERPEGYSLDRIDPNKGYEPGNCRWATPKQQAMNRRDLVVIATPAGEMPLVEYAEKIGISKGAAHLRLKRGKLYGCARI